MKRRFLAMTLIVMLTLAVTCFSDGGAVKAQAQTFEKCDFISGVVIANELNLRTGPSKKFPVIEVLKKNKWLNVLACIGGEWYVVYDPDTDKIGCVAKEYLVDASKVKDNQGGTSGMKSGTGTTPKASPAPASPAAGQLTPEEKQLIDLINKERSNNGVGALAADMELMKVARTKAMDMSQNNYFSHYSPTYGSPFDMMRQFGITFKAAAENIAGNQTVQGAVAAWMKSSGHRTNILNGTYNYTGVGIAKSNKYGYVMVQQFIKK